MAKKVKIKFTGLWSKYCHGDIAAFDEDTLKKIPSTVYEKVTPKGKKPADDGAGEKPGGDGDS